MRTFSRVSRRGLAYNAAAPSISTPASRKRIVSRRSGGQSVRAILETEKADAQSAQNAAIRTDRGIEGAGRRRIATRMDRTDPWLRVQARSPLFNLEIK